MNKPFQGWGVVADQLGKLAAAGGKEHWSLNEGQCASLRAMGARLPNNGVVIADEVGMGKTRIAVALASSVIQAGGRVAILVPPGLGFQWQDELRGGGVEAPVFLRSIGQYLRNWDEASPWFKQNVVLISHGFANWRLGQDSATWRWAMLPALYAEWRKATEGRYPRGYNKLVQGDQTWAERFGTALDDKRAQMALLAAESIAEFVESLPVNHVAREKLESLSEGTPWPKAMHASEYGKGEDLRPWLETAVGLGLGTFDLVIVDEAHKSRSGESGLARLLEQVIIHNHSARRMAMTATPVELDAGQWHQTLKRIGVEGVGLSNNEGDIFQRYADACDKVRRCPNDPDARERFRQLSQQFQAALSPYLLRRDKRELSCVQAFAERSGEPLHAYRSEAEIAVDMALLSPAWRQAVCAAEALSFVSDMVADSTAKRSRLTIGNGHGIASLLDSSQQDTALDCDQIEAEAQEQDSGKNNASVPGDDKRKARTQWWKTALISAFPKDENPLFDHPAILAAIVAIEEIACEKKEKVLVFGRFTRPLQALVLLLNARAMLRALDSGELWAQAKVHENEWPALQAAHRQLHRTGTLDRDALDFQLERQYRHLEERRRVGRLDLLKHLDEAPPLEGRMRAIFDAFRSEVEKVQPNEGESPIVLVAKALHDLQGWQPDGMSATQFADAFTELVEALCERDEGGENGDGQLDEHEAQALWAQLQARIAEEFNRSEGSFARLMYGGTQVKTRRLLQLSFNRPHSHPRVLVAQSVVGREGLNLHKACKTVVLLHPEWNPGVVEQQIGRVDRVGSLWEQQLEDVLKSGAGSGELPRITVRPVVFRGTYDERNWGILRERWDDLRAQLHGVVISSIRGKLANLPEALIGEINGSAPNFSPFRMRFDKG
ncbi:DEAD/DEAH box helicase [Chromobacterium sp. IIBBL 290-4]|uniref:DEAD/DEAH box helicase n=1 Tax=Chromobacterium sp. IIBBL 290-4 TaxID=2953890 RepID=UPI0020B6B898|nr:DEAD/DEAH box helicase [Chromobacterium sp. IIBBL 290-4]UTH75181.1 hypothetical protein NKT35_03525 [Chromobacterium sp. IIBBL 290-4]